MNFPVPTSFFRSFFGLWSWRTHQSFRRVRGAALPLLLLVSFLFFRFCAAASPDDEERGKPRSVIFLGFLHTHLVWEEASQHFRP